MIPITNCERLAPPIQYDGEAHRLHDTIRECLSRDLVIVSGVPDNNDVLIDLLQGFGHILERRRNNFLSATNLIGNVTFRADLKQGERLPTQGSDELDFHTARAFEALRPDLFCMYMADPGWLTEPPGNNGESRILFLQEVIDDLLVTFPHSFSETIRLLLSAPVKYRPWYLDDEAFNGPLLFQESNGSFTFRYWEDFVATISGIPLREEELTAILKFSHIMRNSSKAIEFQLEKGDLIILNNKKVAHARRRFKEHNVHPAGDHVDFSTRKIKSLHVKASA